MGELVIACYRPKLGQRDALLQIVREHVPALRRLGLATERAPLVMSAKDGSVVEIFEWASAEAVERAHHDDVVQGLWERFGQVCDFVPIAALEEAHQAFAHYSPLDP